MIILWGFDRVARGDAGVDKCGGGRAEREREQIGGFFAAAMEDGFLGIITFGFFLLR